MSTGGFDFPDSKIVAALHIQIEAQRSNDMEEQPDLIRQDEQSEILRQIDHAFDKVPPQPQQKPWEKEKPAAVPASPDRER